MKRNFNPPQNSLSLPKLGEENTAVECESKGREFCVPKFQILPEKRQLVISSSVKIPHSPSEFWVTCDFDRCRPTEKSALVNEKSQDKAEPKLPKVKGHQNPFKCVACLYETNQREDLQGHMLSNHPPSADFGCHLCPFHSASLHLLDRHMLTHAGSGQNSNWEYLDDLRVDLNTKNELNTWKRSFVKSKSTESSDQDQQRPSIIVQGPWLTIKKSTRDSKFFNHSHKKMKKVNEKVEISASSLSKLLDCPFCKFSTLSQLTFVTHFNSHRPPLER